MVKSNQKTRKSPRNPQLKIEAMAKVRDGKKKKTAATIKKTSKTKNFKVKSKKNDPADEFINQIIGTFETASGIPSPDDLDMLKKQEAGKQKLKIRLHKFIKDFKNEKGNSQLIQDYSDSDQDYDPNVDDQMDEKQPKKQRKRKPSSKDMVLQFILDALKLSTCTYPNFFEPLSKFITKAYKGSDEKDLQEVTISFAHHISLQQFKKFVMTNDDMPEIFLRSSPQDVVRHALNSLQDLDVLEHGSQKTVKIFFEFLNCSNQPARLPDDDKFSIIEVLKEQFGQILNMTYPYDLDAPKAKFTVVNKDQEHQNLSQIEILTEKPPLPRIGLMLVDFLLEYDLFPLLLRTIKFDFDWKALNKTRFKQGYSAKTKHTDAYTICYALQMRNQFNLSHAVLQLIVMKPDVFASQQILTILNRRDEVNQVQALQMILKYTDCQAIDSNLIQILDAIEKCPRLVEFFQYSSDMNHVPARYCKIISPQQKLLITDKTLADTNRQQNLTLIDRADPFIKLTLSEFADLCKNLRDSNVEFQRAVLSFGLDRAPKNYTQCVQTQTAYDPDNLKFIKYATELATKYSINEQISEKVNLVADQFSQDNQLFKSQELQKIITAILLQNSADGNVASRIRAGMGKTYISLMLAKLLSESGKKVLIVLVNELLYSQCKLEIDKLGLDNIVKAIEIKYLTVQHVQERVVIFDEADYGIDHFVAFISKVQNTPMAVLALKKAVSVVFLSATFDNFHKKFLRKCFGINSIIEFKGAYQIIQQTESDQVNKEMETKSQISAITARFKQILVSKIPNQSVILFVITGSSGLAADYFDKDIEEVISQLNGKSNQNGDLKKEVVEFRLIDNNSKALQARNEFQSSQRFVVRLSNQYAMGLDLKMQKPAFVMILCLDPTVTSDNQLDQMLGRGRRDQGIPQGLVLFLSKNRITSQKLIAQSSSRDYNAADNYAIVYNNFDLVSDWKAIGEILNLENNDWNDLTPQTIRAKHPILNQLCKDN